MEKSCLLPGGMHYIAEFRVGKAKQLGASLGVSIKVSPWGKICCEVRKTPKLANILMLTHPRSLG